MQPNRDEKTGRRSLPSRPIRDWLLGLPPSLQRAMPVLFALLITCGAFAQVDFGGLVPGATHQLLFILIAGTVLTPRMALQAGVYFLGIALVSSLFIPIQQDSTPLLGPLSGYLWATPLSTTAIAVALDRFRLESVPTFAVAISVGMVIFDLLGSIVLLASGSELAQAVLGGIAVYVGLRLAHGALAVFIASSAAKTLQAQS